MSEQFDAIYDHGVLKPFGPLALPDKTLVKVTVDPQLGDSPKEIANRIQNRCESDPSSSDDARSGFDAELEALLFDGPSLPPDFSRADIYADHD